MGNQPSKGGTNKPISAGDSISIGRLQQKMSFDGTTSSTTTTTTRQTSSIDSSLPKSLDQLQSIKLRKNSSQNSAELSQEQQDKSQKDSKVYSSIRLQVQQEQGKEKVNLDQEPDQGSQPVSGQVPQNQLHVSTSTVNTSATQVTQKIQSEFTTQGSQGFSLNFIQKKDGAQIRQNYLKKLVYNKIWLLPQNKPKSHQTVIIFDWDDTLLCTSHLNPSGYLQDLMLSRPLTNQLKNLDKASTNILNLALENGKVIIITNAAPGWVQFSARKYLPEVFSILEKIQIISARGEYQAKYPGNCHQWKMLAFQETQKQLDAGAITNLLALGDSNIQMDAAHHLATKFQKALIKTVKFRQSPSPQELVKQLNLVHQKFNQICHSVRNLTIRLQRKSSRPTNNQQSGGGPSIDGPAPPPGAVPALH